MPTTTLRKTWSEVTKRCIAAQQGFRCRICKNLLGSVWAADHIVPLHLGGTNAKSNLQVICVECHGQKTQKEQMQAACQRREDRTGTSKYWDPQSDSYMFQRHENPRLVQVCLDIRARLHPSQPNGLKSLV